MLRLRKMSPQEMSPENVTGGVTTGAGVIPGMIPDDTGPLDDTGTKKNYRDPEKEPEPIEEPEEEEGE